LGRKRWDLVMWMLIWSLPLITSDILSITCGAGLPSPLSSISALHVEALRTNSLIFHYQCHREEDSQIIIWSFYSVMHFPACLLAGDCNQKSRWYAHLNIYLSLSMNIDLGCNSSLMYSEPFIKLHSCIFMASSLKN
jgi:hypothetical protein